MKKIILNDNGTLKHILVEGVHEISENAISVSDAIATKLLNNRQTKAYINGKVVDFLPPFDFDNVFAIKLTEIVTGFKKAMTPITATYTAEDIASFPTQEAEATSYSSDSNADTPLLDFMVANRPSVDKPTLVSRILANSVIYKQVAGPAIGKKQHYEDLLYALKAQHEDPQQPDVTQEDIDAIVVDFSTS